MAFLITLISICELKLSLFLKGKEVNLEPEAEEIATFYAAALNTEHVDNPTFNENFFRDFKTVLVKSNKVIFCVIKKYITFLLLTMQYIFMIYRILPLRILRVVTSRQY